MPSPLTPEQTFGFGSVPLTSYFKAPKGGSRNTQFSPQARAMLQQDEAYQQEQMQAEADQLVNDLLMQAPNLTDEQINQTLIRNPNIFRGRDAGLVQNYQQFRQQAASPADQKLGMYFYTKLQEDKDPRALQNFQRRMLEEGMSANDAWEAYRVDQFNEPLMQQLAEAGVPREEFDKYKTPTGTFDPVEVSRGIAQTKASTKASRLGKTAEPIDEEIELLKDAMEQRKKRLEATGGDLTKDTVFQDYADSLDKAYQQKRLVLRPPPKPVVGKPTQVAGEPVKTDAAQPTVDAPPAFDINISPEENQARMAQYERGSEERAAKQKVDDSIARAWTNKKMEVIDKLEPLYKTPDEMRAVANSILSGRLSPEATTTPYGGINMYAGGVGKSEPYVDYIAKKIGLKPEGKAFREPESASWNRIGTQTVTNRELLTAWAESFLEADKRAQEFTTAEPTGQPAPASGKFSVGTPVKVGGP